MDFVTTDAEKKTERGSAHLLAEQCPTLVQRVHEQLQATRYVSFAAGYHVGFAKIEHRCNCVVRQAFLGTAGLAECTKD